MDQILGTGRHTGSRKKGEDGGDSPMRELSAEYELTRRILSMVSKDRMYSSFSGLPKVLLALLLVLRFPGEKATELPAGQNTTGNRSGSD